MVPTASQLRLLIDQCRGPLRTPVAATLVALLTATALGWAYFNLNIQQSLFVDRLGCGCKPHYNNNDLTLCVGLFMALPVAAVAGISSRFVVGQLRLPFLGVSFALIGYWFLKFCYFNWWL